MLARPAFVAVLLSSVVLPVASAAAQPQGAAGTLAADAEAAGDIIVTAQKIEQRAVDVPISITAVTGARIRELGVIDLDELSAYIPGLNIQEQSANNPGIVIRGITSDTGSAQQGPRVTTYYNGVDISRSRGVYQGIYDLDRFEVVKGPQATLFGTASTIGAISIVPARPQPGTSAQLTAAYGNFDQQLLSGFVNAGSDMVAGRIAFEFRRRDGYVENLAPGQRDLYAQNNFGIRPSIRITPDDRLTVDLVYTFDRQRNSGTPFISGTLPTEAGPPNVFGPANLGGSPVSREVLGLARLGLRRDVHDLNLSATYEISDRWSFTTVNGYRKFDSLEVFDADGSAAWFLEFAEDARGDQFNHEGRFTFSGDKLRGFLGWNWFHEDGAQRVPFSSEEGTFIRCVNTPAGLAAANALPAPIPSLACVAPGGEVQAARVSGILTRGAAAQLPYSSVFENSGRNDQYSVFADATWIPIPALELTGGVRVLYEQRRSGFFARVPNSVLTRGPLIPTQVDTGGRTFRADDDYWAVLPRFNALYRLSSGINAFATVSKGRRSPVVQLDAQRVGGQPAPRVQLVPEEIVWNYEGGLKVATERFTGSVGLYYQRYRDFQVGVIQPDGRTLTQSAGDANNLGVEAEAVVRPTSWLSLFGNFNYIDAAIERDPSFSTAFSGARFRLQPKWQAAGGFTIDAPIGGDVRFFATPSVTYRSRIFFELPNSPLLSQDAVTLVNARAGLTFGNRFTVAGYIRNATNERYLLDAGNTGGGFGRPTFIPAEPRFYGVELSTRF